MTRRLLMRIATIASRWLAASAFGAAAVLLAPGGSDAVPLASLLVVKAGSGTGRVISVPPDTSIDCGKVCFTTVGIPGTLGQVRAITLLAIPDATAVFADCGNPCTFTPPSETVTATFVDQRVLPDLVVTDFSAPPDPSSPVPGLVVEPLGGVIDVTVTIRNQGTAAAGPFRLGFYWTPTEGFSTLFPDRYDRRTRSVVTCEFPAGLAPTHEATCVTRIDVPPAVSIIVGANLVAIVDDLGQVDESNEGNNVRRLAGGPPVLEPPPLRPATFFVLAPGGGVARRWGDGRDVPVPADYDGDGRTDVAVWRPAGEPEARFWFEFEGDWYIARSSDGGVTTFRWGASDDVPVPADFDGDGRADIAIWRDGAWYIVRSSDGVTVTQRWGARRDVPVPADYDGDGRADLAVWRPSDPADPLEEQGVWYIIRSSDGAAVTQQWGSSALADVPVPGDYDGDGRADLAVWRPRSGTWFILLSSGGSLAIDFGAPGDVPVPRDWDGDGVTDLAVWRPRTGTWWVRRSSDGGVLSIPWGAPGDWPVPGDYNGDGRADPAVFRVDSADIH